MTQQEYIARRATWTEGAVAIAELCKAVAGAMEQAKRKHADMAAVNKSLHQEFGPVFRSIRQAMFNALPDSMLDAELEKVRRKIDGDDDLQERDPGMAPYGLRVGLDDKNANADPTLADKFKPLGAERAAARKAIAKRVRFLS